MGNETMLLPSPGKLYTSSSLRSAPDKDLGQTLIWQNKRWISFILEEIKCKKSSGCQSEARPLLFVSLRSREGTGKSGQVSGTHSSFARAILG